MSLSLLPPREVKPEFDKYDRGKPISLKTKDRKVRKRLRRNESAIKQAEDQAAAAELLDTQESGFLEAEGIEKTYKFTQSTLKKVVDVSTAQKAFELNLDFGSYNCDFTRNGKYLLLGGRKGHITSIDWKSGRLACEFHVNETIRAVKYLHNESLYAVAQKKYVYIYDGSGLEVHCLKQHVEVNALEFLPYHYLLATIGNTGYLKYQDISTGSIVSEHRSRLGACSVLKQNKYNSILHTGHSNGVVNFWTPNMADPAVKMLCHRGPIRDVAIDREGRYMTTVGQDSRLKVWDVRTYREIHDYFTPAPASSLSVSDSGLIGVGWGPHVSIWQDAFRTKQNSPYMTHLQPGSQIGNVQFAPYEDFLGVAHEKGYTSLIVPGSGEANFDAFEANPYQSKQQRRATEIRGLLEKLQPNMIALTPFIGDVDPATSAVRKAEMAEEAAARPVDEYNDRKKQKGRNSSLKRALRKKNKNVIDERRLKMEAVLAKEKQKREERLAKERGMFVEDASLGPALSRFAVHKQRRA